MTLLSMRCALALFVLIGLAAEGGAWWLPGRRSRRATAILVTCAFAILLYHAASLLGSGAWLLLTLAGASYVLKLLNLLERSRDSVRSIGWKPLALYLTVWPGLDPERVPQVFSRAARNADSVPGPN